ncbi:hypothetical protein H0H93_012286 [Arthromyces matolae]|nr:hypothetical protein H0H93_012286 [Arthromyces matolae]
MRVDGRRSTYPEDNPLVPFSSTSRHFRNVAAPILFEIVDNDQRSWAIPYVGDEIFFTRELRLRDYFNIKAYHDYTPKTTAVNLNPLRAIAPTLVNLSRLELSLKMPLDQALFKALLSNSCIESLRFKPVRLDGPLLEDIVRDLPLSRISILSMIVEQDRPRDIVSTEEKNNVRAILKYLSASLTTLEMSGNIVEFPTLAEIQWPQLTHLRMTDRISDGNVIPLSIVVANMPLLRCVSYDFIASLEFQQGPIFGGGCETSPSVFSKIEYLSISNVQPRDRLVDELPASLKTLRVLALRYPFRFYEFSQREHHPYTPLNAREVHRWLTAATSLGDLVELALTTKDAPSPALIAQIASACPRLSTLELEQASFEDIDASLQSQYKLV